MYRGSGGGGRQQLVRESLGIKCMVIELGKMSTVESSRSHMKMAWHLPLCERNSAHDLIYKDYVEINKLLQMRT